MTERRYEAPTIIEIGSVHVLTQAKTLGGCDLICQIVNAVPDPLDQIPTINISGSFP